MNLRCWVYSYNYSISGGFQKKTACVYSVNRTPEYLQSFMGNRVIGTETCEFVDEAGYKNNECSRRTTTTHCR